MRFCPKRVEPGRFRCFSVTSKLHGNNMFGFLGVDVCFWRETSLNGSRQMNTIIIDGYTP